MDKMIVVVGSLNADLVARLPRAPEAGETLVGDRFEVFCGGKGANQAYAAGKVGGQVAMLGRVGDDPYGEKLRNNLKSANVSVDEVRLLKGVSSGTAMVTVEDSGENRIVVIPGANGELKPSDVEEAGALLSRAQIGLFQLESPLDTIEAALSAVKQGGGLTVLDPAPAQDLMGSMYSLVDYLTPNLTELSLLSGRELSESADVATIASAAECLLERGAGCVIVKMGSQGALRVDKEKSRFVKAFPVQAVDTTGAGDCFNGAFAVSKMNGMSDVQAVRFACAAASVSVGREGAQASMPSLDEVDAIFR